MNRTPQSASAPSQRAIPKQAQEEDASFAAVAAIYTSKTDTTVRAIDAYLLFCVATGLLQLAYFAAVKGRPYQSFVAGFVSSLGSFVLGVNIRLHMTNQDDCGSKDTGRAITEFILGHVILHMLVGNFFTVVL